MKKIITFKTAILTFLPFYLSIFLLSGCSSARYHSSQLHSAADRDLTVGLVQRDIQKGMPASEVARILGSPNIVTKDTADSQTWVYDKIATEASYSRDGGGLFLLLLNFDSAAGASATTQKTLTVVIKFDKNDRVSDFNYHSTKF
jgi:outer membrane protein assembly factor BamE (lipoprotein component of BamABCDE complex)